MPNQTMGNRVSILETWRGCAERRTEEMKLVSLKNQEMIIELVSRVGKIGVTLKMLAWMCGLMMPAMVSALIYLAMNSRVGG